MNIGYQETREADSPGNPFRETYVGDLQKLIEQRQHLADRARAAYVTSAKLREDPGKYRADFINMLGWPLNAYTPGDVKLVQSVQVAKTETEEIYRLQLEPLPGLRFYGMLFVPAEKDAKIPLIVSQHGGQGTPELCSSIFASSANYHEMTQRILRRGAAVFAPQLLLWDKGKYGVSYDRQQVDEKLKQIGGSIAALEITCLRKCIDYLTENLAYLDSARIGMVGLSYGGFYTLFTAAAEPRIKAAYSSCFFNSRYAYPWSDWVWKDSANRFLDAEVAALIAPRTLYLEVADHDELFTPEGAVGEYKRLLSYYEAQGAADKLRFHVIEGVHELSTTDEGIDFLFSGL